MELRIEAAILERFPECRVGGFLVRGLGRAAASLAEDPVPLSEADLAGLGVTQQNLADEPRIRAWRQAIAKCGLKPSTYKSSPEQLAARVLRGRGISTPLPVVTAYCAVSVRHLAPLGAYDVHCLPEPAVALRLPRGGDRFQPLGGRPEDMPLSEGVALYAAGSEVICWAFNHRDSAATCLREETDEALFVAEAAAEVQHRALAAALAEMSELLARRGAEVAPTRFAGASAPAVRL